jgi:DNA repair protein RadC
MQEIHDTGFTMDGQGYYTTRLVRDEEIIQLSTHIIGQRLLRGEPLQSPRDSARYLQHRTALLEHEVFGMIWLDNRHRVIAVEELFRGTINGTAVYPREVVKSALFHNAAAAIAWHNHPTGNPEPSRADEVLTAKLKAALDVIDVRLIDHLVVGGEGVVSFAERGLL